MKKIFKLIIIFSIIWLIGSIILYKQYKKPMPEVAENEYLLPSEIYKPPLIKIPFIKDKAPVSKANLPIPRKDVKTTIVVTSPVPDAKKITLIVDKKGKVYKSKDTPKDVEIKVTHWKPPFFGLQNKWGVGIAMDIPPDLSFILSWDTIRIWRLYFGVDLGTNFTDYGFTDFWVGTSVKYKILKNNNLFALAGYNWIEKVLYVGVSMRL